MGFIGAGTEIDPIEATLNEVVFMNALALQPETILAAAPCAVLIYDDQGTVRYRNPAANQLLDGLQQEPSVRGLFGCEPHREAAAGRVLLALADGRKLRAEISTFQEPDTEVDWHSLWLHPSGKIGQEEPLQALVGLIPRVVHDLRNPLAGIQSLTELMIEETTSEQQREDLQGILEEVHLLELHLERLRLAESFDPHNGHMRDLASALSSLADFFSVRAKRVGVTFRFVEPPAQETSLHPKFLMRMVGNVLHTALEMGEGGSLTFKLDAQPAWLWFAMERHPQRFVKGSEPMQESRLLRLMERTLATMGGRLETKTQDDGWLIRLGIGC